MMDTSPQRNRGGYVRGAAVAYDGGTKVTYEWPCGHREVTDFGSKRRPLAKRMGAAGARMMASWHSVAKGGVNLPLCKKCLKTETSK